MNNFKKDFPILNKNQDLVYLDSTASSQKPSYVIDGIKNYLENDYYNKKSYIIETSKNPN